MNYEIYILAEGRSTRMGEDKGLVKVNGQALIQYSIDYLKPLQKKISIVTSNPVYEQFGYRIVSDKVKDQGPAQGIITCLENAQADHVLIVSCDMPLINTQLIQLIQAATKQRLITCFADEYLFPFPGMYTKQILKIWKEKVLKGERTLQKLIPQFDYKKLPIEYPDLFLNANTPSDLELIKEKIK